MPRRRNAPSSRPRPRRPAAASWYGALTAEHHALAYLAGRLQAGADGREAATAAEWIATLFAGHVAKVNDKLLPALIASGADLAALLADMREEQPARKRDGAWGGRRS